MEPPKRTADSASRDTEKGGVPHGPYAIGDLHLSLTADKPMEVFGPAWENYTERIGDALSRLTAGDVLVLAGTPPGAST